MRAKKKRLGKNMDVLVGGIPDALAPSRNEEMMQGKTTAENNACKTKQIVKVANKQKEMF
jgi:hypothetical protein